MNATLAPLPVVRATFKVLDPLLEPAWDSRVSSQLGSSFFHSRAWAQVLHQTYGHQPVYFGHLADGQLGDLLPVMEVASAVTGHRGVSLPFTDFCAPLTGAASDGQELYEFAVEQGRQRRWRYLECRGNARGWKNATPSLAFYGHLLDLQPDPERLFPQLESAIRRGIKKAVEGKLRVQFSSDLESVRIYYALHCQTRQGHGLPPQPFKFFENIAKYVLEPGHGFVATVWLGEKPVAGAIFFQHGHEVLYKFGASDYSFQHLRPNNLMMWEAIKRCAALGFRSLHFGRTSLGNEGLRRFKLGFGAREERIYYYKYDFAAESFVTGVDRAESWVNRVFRPMPLPLLRLAGRLLYPHLS